MSNTHNAVCHAWAHQTGKARKGFNMYYEGATIYSYGQHFPIARLVLECSTVLFTSKRYSVSTSKHKSYTARACGHLRQFTVPDVLATSPEAHLVNYQAYITLAKSYIDQAKRARTRKDWLLQMAEETVTEANDYSQTFTLRQPELALTDIEVTAAILLREAQEVADRRREATERNAREVKRELRAENKPKVRAWLLGTSEALRLHTSRPLVRVKGDVVETTWGAVVPLNDAVKLFRLAAVVRKTGKEWIASGLKAFKAGDFAVTRIGLTGNMVVGCHDIPFRFAKLAAERAGIHLI